jgi:hypothetical protein
MQSYEQAAVKLGNRDSRKLANHTYVQRRGEDIAVRLHATDVVLYHKDGTITLNSGGWRTPTTKARINAYIPGRGLHQKNSLWYFSDGDIFEDGIRIDQSGYPFHSVISGEGMPTRKAQIEAEMRMKKKRVKEYIDGFCEHITQGKLTLPGGGDCWYCLMFEKAGQSSDDHIRNHMSEEEKYYVPSLLFNAIKAKGFSQPEFTFQMIMEDGKRGKLYWNVRRVLRDYLMKRDV